jgi:hypothetical protein
MGMKYELGKNGNLVYMFDLKCQEGQHPLPTCAPKSRIHIANINASSNKSIYLKKKNGIICQSLMSQAIHVVKRTMENLSSIF